MSLTYGDAEGKDATVLLLGPGDLFGAMEGAEDLDYSQNLRALKPTVLCRMTQAQMEGLLNKHPEIGYRHQVLLAAHRPAAAAPRRNHNQVGTCAPGDDARQSVH